jgi:hypothetical protein
MVTMIDEIYDRHYREARADVNAALIAGITHLRRSVGNAFQVLNRIEYDAPWARKAKKVRCN